MRVLQVFSVLVLAAATLLAQAPSPVLGNTRSVRHLLPQAHDSVQIERVPNEPLDGPHWWNSGATFTNIYSHGERPNIVMFRRDGSLAFKATLTAPDMDRIIVSDAAALKRGGVVTSVEYVNRSEKVGAYVAALDEQGRVVQQLTTFPFIPEMVCPAEDGTIWAFGWDWYAGHPDVSPPSSAPATSPYRSNALIEHFRFNDGLIGRPVTQNEIGSFILFGHNVVRGTAVGCTNDKAWVYYGEGDLFLAYEEKTRSVRRYSIVMPSDGADKIGADKIGMTGFARTASGDFYGSLSDGGLYWLYVHADRAEWVLIDGPNDFTSSVAVVGAGGDDLVYIGRASSTVLLRFSTMPSGSKPEPLAQQAPQR